MVRAFVLVCGAMMMTARGAETVSAPAPTAPTEAAAWLNQVDPLPDPGRLKAPAPFTAQYRIAWSGFTAARVDVATVLTAEEVQTILKTSTIGLTRSMWQMDAVHTAIADRRTLRPLRIDETDKRDDRAIVTHVDFSPAGAVRTMRVDPSDGSSPTSAKPKAFDYPQMLDAHTALLALQNVPLAPGDVHTALVMTVTNPYLVTIKAENREPIDIAAGHFDAVRCTVSLAKIAKDGELQPQKKFKSADIWISDDEKRTVLKAEVKIFIGSVLLELERFSESGKPKESPNAATSHAG